MFLAEEAAASGGVFNGFDVFVIAFTLLLIIAVIRSATAKQKNLFAIAFGIVSLGVFVIMDMVMIKGWF